MHCIVEWKIIMRENQNTEYKELWHDDYLKWICGFATKEALREALLNAICHKD